MARHNFRLPLRLVLGAGLFIEVVLTVVLPIQVQAQLAPVTSHNTLSRRSVVRVTFEPPGDEKPKDTAGGASRDTGRCPQDTTALATSVTPLMPATRQGLTVAEHPTFFVYVPQTSAQKALFVLKDDKEDYYYQKIVSIPRMAGIVSFKLPADAPAIEIGKSYKWSFVMICGEGIRPDSPTVEGRIERIAPNPTLSKQLNTLLPLERAAMYGKDGIWYDTLTTLAQLKRSQPNDVTLAANWQELLTSVGLEAIATKPLLNLDPS
ncbi:MAG: DUF928 domain-containing protein [Coleofasciculus sp. Co-bin14]|nr:DUF928 domain-containing protein [Coleofasciculus sp. Co-bin14]